MQDTSIQNLIARLARRVLRPSMLRTLTRAAAWTAGVFMVAVTAAVLALHVWILPRIGDFRPQLEKIASAALGLTVRIDEIVLVRQGLQPTVELRGVRFVDEVGNAGLHVDAVQAEASLMTLARSRFARLAVIRPAMQARRGADGRIFVAGLALFRGAAGELPQEAEANAALDWLLSQPELEIRDGSILWNDAQRNAPPLEITQVQASLKTSGRRHVLQLSLTPPAGWGQPVAVTANWRHGLWEDRSRWSKWSGAVQADIAEVDISPLRQYVDLGKNISLRQGRGRMRVQAEFREGLRSSAVVDASLDAVDMTLGKDLPPLALRSLAGVFKVRFDQGGERNSYSLITEGLSFVTDDNLRWPGGNVRVNYHDAANPAARGGEIQGNDWDIGIISQLAGRLPLGDAMLRALKRYQPQGQIQELNLAWQGELDAPDAYAVRGKASQVGWLSHPGATRELDNRPGIGTPGLQGAKVDFDFSQSGGSMDLSLDKGSAEFPGVFEKPRLDFDKFQTKVQWRKQGQQIHVTLPKIQFANADARGTVRVAWKTYEGAVAEQRFPGMLDLEGVLQQARAEQVVRYLPLDLGRDALDYVGNAVRSGDIHNARVRIQGDLNHVPFGRDSHGVDHPGIFRFEVPLSNAEYRFVPRYLQNVSDKPWPALKGLNGMLVIDKSSLSVLDATARFSTAPGIVVNNLSAHIPDLGHHLAVGIAADMRGPLEQALQLTKQSPLSDILRNSLTQTTATGMADISLTLGLPIMHMDVATVKGAVNLQDNDIRLSPGSPLLGKSRGRVAFDEKGFVLQDVTASLLGGKAELKGGSLAADKNENARDVKVDVQGDFTAEGLRQEPAAGAMAQLGRFLNGRSAYRAVLQATPGSFELTVDSDLDGMASNLPAPLGKNASGKLPFHYSNRVVKNTKSRNATDVAAEDELQVRIGQMVFAQYVRDVRNAEKPRVLRGRIGVGAQVVREPPPMPGSGVRALVKMERVDADAWSRVLDSGWGRTLKPSAKQDANGNDASALAAAAVGGYFPDQFMMQTPLFTFANRTFESLVMDGTREDRLWKLSLSARQLDGYVEYLQSATGGPGGIKARLNHLIVAPANMEEVGNYVRQTADPQTLPFLDIDAAQVDLAGYKFDRLVLRASNSAQARPAGAELVDDASVQGARNIWRIHELTARMPNGSLQGSGTWGIHAPSENRKLQPADLARRFVSLDVRAQTSNLGTVLAHFGHPGIVRGGEGNVSGTIRWDGSPATFDMETLAGGLRLDIRKGHIIKMDPGAVKIFSLLSLQGLTRWGAVAQEGFAFDRIHASLHINQGAARTDDLVVRGPIADVKASGQIGLARNILDLDLVVQPKVDLSTAALAATAVHPLVGVGSYVAQWILSKPINALATQVWSVTGPLSDPAVTRLQGKEAGLAADRVMKQQAAPATFNPLLDWDPATDDGPPAPAAEAASP